MPETGDKREAPLHTARHAASTGDTFTDSGAEQRRRLRTQRRVSGGVAGDKYDAGRWWFTSGAI